MASNTHTKICKTREWWAKGKLLLHLHMDLVLQGVGLHVAREPDLLVGEKLPVTGGGRGTATEKTEEAIADPAWILRPTICSATTHGAPQAEGKEKDHAGEEKTCRLLLLGGSTAFLATFRFQPTSFVFTHEPINHISLVIRRVKPRPPPRQGDQS